MTDLLEQQLADALSAARSDDRWALAGRPDAVSSVLSAGRRRRARSTALAVASALVVGGTAVYGVSALPDGRDRLGQVAGQAPPDGPAAAQGTPVPGVTPAWAPASGREWLLTGPELDAWRGSHTVADHLTGQSRVPSPAPLDRPSQRLLDDVAPALPAGARSTREDAPGGDPDTTALHVVLADGTPVEVERTRLDQPLAWDEMGGDGVAHPGWRVEDVPGTSAALLLQPDAGYGFPGRTDGANAVAVVTRDGEWTDLVSPAAVPVETLRGWALQVAQG